MNTEQALAVLAELEATHGPGVLATILGAAFRRDSLQTYESDWMDEFEGTPQEWVEDDLLENDRFWLDEFADCEAFRDTALGKAE